MCNYKKGIYIDRATHMILFFEGKNHNFLENYEETKYLEQVEK